MSDILDIQARFEIQELLSRYCHRVDHNDADGWAELFTDDGVFDVVGAFRLQGTAQLRTMPGVVAEKGGGKWRHRITNVVAEPGETADSAVVLAYGLVTDWREGGKPVSFTDYLIEVKHVDGEWKIVNLAAHAV